MFCDNCGQENPDGTRFCAGCGRVVSGSAAAMATAAEAARRLHSAATTAARSPAAKSSASLFSAVFGNFDVMLTPRIITVIFWLLVIANMAFGLMAFGMPGILEIVNDSAGMGILLLMTAVAFGAFGILASRIFCEFLIVTFKIHQALQDIRTQTARP